MDAFEKKTEEQIEKQRADAARYKALAIACDVHVEKLVRALAAYRGQPVGPIPAPKSGLGLNPQEPRQADFQIPPPKNGHALAPGSNTYKLLKVIHSSGFDGMTIQGVYEGMRALGYENESAIRSMVYSQKKIDRILLRGGRYYTPAHCTPDKGLHPGVLDFAEGDTPKRN